MSWNVVYGIGGFDESKPNNNVVAVEWTEDEVGDKKRPPIALERLSYVFL
jgi:hypothetical protein